MELFKNEEKENTPVAIIQNGTTENEKIGIGTVASIEHKAKEQQLSNPAIIVIGEVVNHRQRVLDIQREYQFQGEKLQERV